MVFVAMADWPAPEAGGGGGAAAAAASRDFVTPLTFKLQQVWLQTQLRAGGGVGGPVFLNTCSPPVLITDPQPSTPIGGAATPSSSSESGDDAWPSTAGAARYSNSGEDRDALLLYIDKMLMEDQIDKQACLDVEMGVGAFQAELEELIQQSSPSGNCHNQQVSSGAKVSPTSGWSAGQSSSNFVQSSSPNSSFKKRSLEESSSSGGKYFSVKAAGFPEREQLFDLLKNVQYREQQQQQQQLVSPPPRNQRLAAVWSRLELDHKNTLLLDKLVACAEAVSRGDFCTASSYIEALRQEAAPEGNPVQRVVFYFVDALIARMSNIGPKMFNAMCNARPSTAEMLKGVQMILKWTPFLSLPYLFANRMILDAIRGHYRVHIVDFGIMYGFQWPALFQLLAELPEGPPQLRITGVDLPPPGFKPSGRIRETGRRLKECAANWGIPFKFRALSSKWQSIEPAELQLKKEEVLIINCMFKQTNLFDELVIAESPKKLWLNRMRSLNPKLFIQCLASSDFSPPIFMTCFEEALSHHVTIFEAMGSCISKMLPELRQIEQDKYGREIMNIIACDGFHRVERSETHQKWQRRGVKAGLEMVPVNPALFEECREFAASFNKDLTVDRDSEWIGLGWKHQVVHAYSAWRPVPSWDGTTAQR